MREEILKRKTCAYCGCLIEEGNGTIDHIIPKAVGAWTDGSVKGLDCSKNMVMSCKRCNVKKSSQIWSLDECFVAIKEIPSGFISLHRRYEQWMIEYKENKKKMYLTQGRKCGHCNKYRPEDKMDVRRKNAMEDKVWANGILICDKCRVRYTNLKKRERKVARNRLNNV